MKLPYTHTCPEGEVDDGRWAWSPADGWYRTDLAARPTGPECGRSIDCAYGCGGPDCEPHPQGVDTRAAQCAASRETVDTWLALSNLLWPALSDGGLKREAGVKPHWSIDEHEPAFHRHVRAWEGAPYGFDPDPDSGAHPLVHAAARALMIAGQELGIARQR